MAPLDTREYRSHIDPSSGPATSRDVYGEKEDVCAWRDAEYARCAWETASEQGKRKNVRSFVYILLLLVFFNSASRTARPASSVSTHYAHTRYSRREVPSEVCTISKRGRARFIIPEARALLQNIFSLLCGLGFFLWWHIIYNND